MWNWNFLRRRRRHKYVQVKLLLYILEQGVATMTQVSELQDSFDAFVPVAQKAFADGAQAFSDVSAKYDVLIGEIVALKEKVANNGVVTQAELDSLRSHVNTGLASLSTAAASQEEAAAALEAKIALPEPEPNPTPTPEPEPNPEPSPEPTPEPPAEPAQ